MIKAEVGSRLWLYWWLGKPEHLFVQEWGAMEEKIGRSGVKIGGVGEGVGRLPQVTGAGLGGRCAFGWGGGGNYENELLRCAVGMSKLLQLCR